VPQTCPLCGDRCGRREAVHLADEEPSSGHEHAMNLAQSADLIRPVLDRAAADDSVEVVVGEGQPGDVADLEVESGRGRRMRRVPPCQVDHGRREIDAPDLGHGEALGSENRELSGAAPTSRQRRTPSMPAKDSSTRAGKTSRKADWTPWS
jgi:hypothetical protein